MNRRYSAVATTLALLLASGHVMAQEPEADMPAPANEPSSAAKQEAARRFEHAIKLYEEADYMLALAEFERVYELVPDYRVLYNIGQVSIQLGQYARALRTLREYLKRGGVDLPSDRVAAIQSDISLLIGRTAALSVEVEPPGAEVTINGTSVGKAPLSEAVVVDVGQRTIQVKLPGYVPQSETVTLAGGDQRNFRFVLEQESQAIVAPTPILADPRPGPDASTKSNRWTWVGWTATGALTAGAVVAGVMGASAASDLKDMRSKPTDRDQLDDAQSRAQSRLLVADILGAAAVATGAVTLYFQLSGSRAKEQPATGLKLRLLPNHVALTLER